MAREVTVVTPENVTITYELAGLGSRAIACFLDSLIQLGSLGILAILFLVTFLLLGLREDSPFMRTLGDFATAIIIIAIFLVVVGYFIFFEAVRNGQTPGKKMLGLRVVREEGGPLDASGAVIRNLVRVIEFVVGMHVSSIVFILFSPKYKRLGDYAAGTMVVRELKVVAAVPDSPPAPKPVYARPETSLLRDVQPLTVDEIATVRRFVERRIELAPDVQERLARQIVAPLMRKLALAAAPGQFSCTALLVELYHYCVEERGLV